MEQITHLQTFLLLMLRSCGLAFVNLLFMINEYIPFLKSLYFTVLNITGQKLHRIEALAYTDPEKYFRAHWIDFQCALLT